MEYADFEVVRESYEPSEEDLAELDEYLSNVSDVDVDEMYKYFN